jgi:hypothetical protein
MGATARHLKAHTGMASGVVTDMEDAFEELFNIEMLDAPDVGGGGTTSAMGFNVLDWRGNAIAEAVAVKLGVFDDEDLQTAAVNATIDTATAGSILSGAASNALVVKTDATGQFRATLTDAADEEVWMSTGRDDYGDRLIDHRAKDSVEFTA